MKEIKDAIFKAQKFQKEMDAKGFGRPSKPAIEQYPHCDMKVLHAPGFCEYCDRHPDWQELREVWGIAFTGQPDPSKTPCPAEQARPVEKIHRWGGNAPTTEIINEEPDAV